MTELQAGLRAPAASPWGKARKCIGAWYWASRPFTLTASVVPVFVGSSLAFLEGRASPGLFVLVLLASVLVQVGTNLVDEYSDHDRPAGKEKLLAPYKVIARGVLSSAAVKRGTLVVFGGATVIGVYLVAITGWPLLMACLASVAVAFLYAGGPRPLGTLGLGHPLVFVFMGPVMVVGSYYVFAQILTLDAFLLSLPVGCTVTAILAANDLRDLEEDVAGGKKTLVTWLGRGFGRAQWLFLVVAAFLMVAVLAGLGKLPVPALLTLVALVPATSAAQATLRAGNRPAFATALRGTARFHGWFGLSLATGVALGRFIGS